MANKINIKIEAQDNASKPIRGIVGANETLQNRISSLNKTLEIQKQRLQEAQASGKAKKSTLMALQASIDQTEQKLKSANAEFDQGSQKAGKFRSAMESLGGTLARTSVAIGAAGLAAGTAGVAIGFGFNNSVEQAETKLMAFMQSQERVAKTMKWVKDEAAKTQFSFTDMADAAAQLTPTANVSGIALEDLVRQAEVLAAINPAEGLSGAAFSLREALSNDWVSIVERFNLPRVRINQLKEEGVPAMEAIKRVLKEMGIDYGLVAAQGQTVSARFDQVKDKLTMMAGAATKPIFDRVSKELDTLGKFDYAALGNQMAGVVSGAVKAFDDFVPKVQEVGKQVGDYLGPKFGALWQTVQEDLVPALSNLWRNVLEPLIPVVGGALVGALGLATDAFTIALQVISPLIDFLANNEWVIWGVVGAFGAFKAALAIQAGVAAFQAGIAAMTGANGLALLTGTFRGAAGLIGGPLVMPAIAIGAAIGALKAVIDKANETIGVVKGVGDAVDKNRRAGEETDKAIRRLHDEGKISTERLNAYLRNTQSVADQAKSNMYSGFFGPMQKSFDDLFVRMSGAQDKFKGSGFGGHASGTNYAHGGMKMVGEHGPEPVILPRGAQVVPNYRARAGEMPAPSGHTVVIQNMNINNGGDYRRMLSDIGFALELAS